MFTSTLFLLSFVSFILSSINGLKIIATYPSKNLNFKQSFYIRGNGCGLSWSEGKMMTQSIGNKNSWEYDIVTCEDTITTLEVKVLINDHTWMIGSNHHISLIDKPDSDTFYPWFNIYEGTLKTFQSIYSSELMNSRDIIVYLPPSYYENTLKTYTNVLIMHDGQNIFDPSTSAFGTAWMCQDTLNDLIVQGEMNEVIIIALYNTANRTDEYTYIYDPSEKAGGKGDLYLDWIESTVIPLATSNLRVSIERDNFGILGSSLGGLISCYAGWTRPNIYGKVGCMSSSFWWDSNDFQQNIITLSTPDQPSYPSLYMDSGTGSTGELQCTEYTEEIYKYSLSVNFTENINLLKYVDQGAVHNEAAWGARFNIPMKFLYPLSSV